MNRALFALLFLAGGAALATTPPRACPPFQELRPPRITRDGTVLWFTRGVDPDWFDCARSAGGRIHGRSLVERNGVWDVDSGTDNVGAKVNLGAWASNYCGRIGKADPTRVRFEITGSGALSPASFTSEIVPALCGCGAYHQVDLKPVATSDGLSVKGTVNPVWLACARAGGGELELRVYTGKTDAEALATVVPAAVLRGLETKPTFAATFSKKQVCKAGAQVAVVELAGRGQLSGATTEGATQVALKCR